MRELVRRRAALEPVAYLVGHREFFGLDFLVTPAVLIPRPDTETLVLALIESAKSLPAPRILDLCTGSGCIAIAASVHIPHATLTAVDIDKAALKVAQENAKRHTLTERIAFHQGDLFGPLAENSQFDAIVSNPPYVTAAELPTLQADVLHEPRLALDGGADGLDIVRRLVIEAEQHLAAGGRLLIEIAPEQAEAVQALLSARQCYGDIKAITDLSGKKRVVSAQKSSPSP